MDDDDLSELAMCAVRYALGRMTYVSLSVPNAIMKYKLSLTTNALHVMLRDIKEYRDLYEKIGMDCDDESWRNFEQWLEQEIKLRKINNTEKAS
jgi:hypothetical protein